MFDVNNTAGIRNPTAASSRSASRSRNIASQNEVNPNGPFFSTNVAAPQIRQPWTSQTSAGWSHELTPSTVFDVDYVHVDGTDLGVRWPLNTRINGGDAPLRRSGAQPGQPDDEHERRREHVTTASTSASAGAWTTASQLNAWYSLVEGEGPRRAQASTS